MQSSSSLEGELAKILVHTGGLQFGLFELSGGKLSSYYLDMRVVPSFPGAFQTATKMLVDKAREIGEVGKVGGIPTGGLVWASVLAYSLSRPLVYARKDVKYHGREKLVEGILTPGEKVLVVDDVITSGKSILHAVTSLRGEGAVVEDVLVLLDREEGGRERLKNAGLKLHSVAKISGVAEELLRREAITKEQYDEVTKSENPKSPDSIEPSE